MKMMLIGLISLVMILPLTAQIDLPRPSFNPYQGSGSSLLDLNRISMNHSMGFSAGVSSAGSGYYLSRYTNHLRYSFNPKLDMELDLNFVNFGSTNSSFEFNADNRSTIIPEFKLNYRPSESVQLQIEFRQGNPWMPYDKPWYERW